MPASVGQAPHIRTALVRWYERHRRDLPWRWTNDPYHILLSEIMLQQTQVDRVIPKFHAWLKQFPTVEALARATPRDVLLAWEGMGYNRRALYLHRTAQEVVSRFGGRVPTTVDDLRTLPGVGAYTAAAVATFATGRPRAFMDTNVRRVLTRLFVGAVVPKRWMNDQTVLELVAAVMPRRPIRGLPPGQWGHLLMDFGALVCKSRPKCEICPLQKTCKAYPAVLDPSMRTVKRANERIERVLPNRLYRGRILQLVREHDPHPVRMREIGSHILPGFQENDQEWLQKLLQGLVRDGLLVWADPWERALQLPT